MSAPTWLRHVVVRQTVWKTTWAFRVVSVGLLCVLAQVTSPVWTRAIAESLVCRQAGNLGGVDAVVIDDLESNYVPFERARTLRERGVGSRVVVPVGAGPDGAPLAVSAEFVKVLARLARVGDVETVPVVEAEPISLNVALHLRRYLADKGIRSVAVLAPAFRSERSMLIYQAVMDPAGIATYCVPAASPRTSLNWTETWHGMQDVALQFVKLQYYRLYVLPFRSGEPDGNL